jgi:hypothetical protein
MAIYSLNLFLLNKTGIIKMVIANMILAVSENNEERRFEGKIVINQ